MQPAVAKMVRNKPAYLCPARCRQWAVLAVLAVLALHFVAQIRLAPSRHKLTQDDVDRRLQLRGWAAADLEPDGSAQEDDLQDQGDDAPLLIDTPGCRIPDLAANSSEVAAFVADYDMGGVCDDPPPLVRSTDTTLFVDAEALAAYGLPPGPGARGLVRCCYTAMWRDRPAARVPDWTAAGTMPPPGRRKGVLWDKVSYGNRIRFGSACEPFFEPTVVMHEFVRVNCTVLSPSLGVRRLRDYHAFVPLRRPRGSADGDDVTVTEDALSVLIVGVDSVSRLNAQRTMPRTLAFLDQVLSTTPLLGYNKVEDNTFPNLVPLLSGLSVPELRRRCWDDDHGGNDAHFDACPWVWKRLNARGYVNMFAEDTAWMGLFHYLKRGFVQQPTDYDPRPLLYEGERDLGRKLRRGGTPVCIGQRTELDVLFDYGAKFVRAMAAARRKFFGVVWGTSLSHDNLNAPAAADALYERFLGDVRDAGVLNSTALVFMSDHGLRFGDILKTSQGRLEERLPLMHVALPQWVRERYPEAMQNLRHNSRRLVTVFDLHETLSNFAHLPSLREAAAPGQEQAPAALPRGLSLFSRIPGERTCDAAGIPSHYCACQTADAVPVDDHRVLQVSEFLVSEVNTLLPAPPGPGRPSPCSTLRLHKVLDARRGPVRTRTGMGPALGTGAALEHRYELVVQTRPGGALLSGTIVYRLGTATMRLDGTVSRLNRYGTQGRCVSDFKQRLFCQCRQPPASTSTEGHQHLQLK